jgi:hypothetical protein
LATTHECLSYNVVKRTVHHESALEMKFASYDTMMYLYMELAFSDIPGLDRNKLESYCALLFHMKRGPKWMKRLHMPCLGTQVTRENLIAMKRTMERFYYTPKGRGSKGEKRGKQRRAETQKMRRFFHLKKKDEDKIRTMVKDKTLKNDHGLFGFYFN